MMYSKKRKMDRRNSVIAAVKKELKAHNAYIAPEQLRAIAQAIDTTTYYRIVVHRSVEDAAEALRLEDSRTEHSWAGKDGVKEEATVVFGDVKFGEKYFYEYFDNGNSTGAERRTVDGEFDTNKPFAFLLHTEDWDTWERGCDNHDDAWDSIVIYAPESIIDEEAYTAAKNAELEELCTLR